MCLCTGDFFVVSSVKKYVFIYRFFSKQVEHRALATHKGNEYQNVSMCIEGIQTNSRSGTKKDETTKSTTEKMYNREKDTTRHQNISKC